MRYCEKCKVNVESNLKNCPLCGAYLKSDDGAKPNNIHAYPNIRDMRRSRRILLKLMIYVTIIASFACVAVDLGVNKRFVWSHHLLFAFACFWASIARTLFFSLPVRRQLFWATAVAIAVVFYAEYFSGSTSGWGFSLALPIVFMSSIAAFVIAMCIDFRRWRMYAMTVTPIAVIDFLMMFLYLIIVKDINWAWYVASGLGFVLIASFVIFGKGDYFDELKRRLHF